MKFKAIPVLAFFFSVVVAPAVIAAEPEYEPAIFLRVTNTGFAQSYNGVKVAMLVSYGGPISNVSMSFPPGYETDVLVSLGPPGGGGESKGPWIGGNAAAYVEPESSDWAFTTPIGTQLVVLGTARVVELNTASGFFMPPLVYVVVDDVLPSTQFERLEREWETAREKPRESASEKASRERSRKIELDTAVLSDLAPEDERRRTEVIKEALESLDLAGVDEKRVRRNMVDQALVRAGLPKLIDTEKIE